MKTGTRPYRMVARAEAAAATARRIVGAMQELFAEVPWDGITIEGVAARAGVTVQTVLRRFGSKEALFAAAVDAGRDRILAQRGAAPAGDRRAGVRNLFDHYEAWGKVVVRLLEQEHRLPQIGALVAEGRRTHAAWVERIFAADLDRRSARRRERLRTQLVAVTDVYVWRLLRLDLHVPRGEAEEVVVGILDALCAGGDA